MSTKDKKQKYPLFGSRNVEAWACTEIEQDTFSFLWSVKNFSSLTSKGTEKTKSDDLKSPIFKGGSQKNSWQLEINAKNKKFGFDYLSIRLNLVSFGDGNNSIGRKIIVKFQLAILDGDGRPSEQSGDMGLCEFERDSCWGYKNFIRTKALIRNKRLLENDCLKIHCSIQIEGNWKHKIGNGSDLGKALGKEDELKGKLLCGLSGELGKLLSSSEMADVSISITTPKHTFMAHRMILAARSPVFKRMFEIDMVESKTHSVDIPDFDKEVVQGMLEYMYTGYTEILDKKAPELLQIAEKYDLGGLKEVCEIQIANNLTVKNAAEVLSLAHLHNASTLKSAVISFINRNKDAVKKTKTFKDVAQAKANRDAFVDLYLSQV